MNGQVGIQIEVMRPKSQSGAQNNLIEDGGGGVDYQICSAPRAYYRPQVARVGLDNLNLAFFAKKPPCAQSVAVSAPDGVALAGQKFRQQGTCAARSQNENF